MIGTLDIGITSFRQNVPLETFRSFVGSASSVRLRNVPKDIGTWKITNVLICVKYPDNAIRSDECVCTNGIWVGTLVAPTRSGTCKNGFQVVASGIDENGNPVRGYVLGIGDVEIYDRDQTMTIGGEAYHLRLLDTTPTTPSKGDVVNEGGAWKIYSGTAWIGFGGGGDEIWEADDACCQIRAKDKYGCYDVVVRENRISTNGISSPNLFVGCSVNFENSSAGITAYEIPYLNQPAQITMYSDGTRSQIDLQSDSLTWNGQPIGGGDSIWVVESGCAIVKLCDNYNWYCLAVGGVSLGGCAMCTYQLYVQDYVQFQNSWGGCIEAPCVEYLCHAANIAINSYCGKSRISIESDELLWNGEPIGSGASGGNWILYRNVGGWHDGCFYSVDNVLLTFEEHPTTGKWLLKGNGEPYGSREQPVGSIYAVRGGCGGCIEVVGTDHCNFVWQDPCAYSYGGYDKEFYLFCSGILNMTVGDYGTCVFGLSLSPVLSSFNS